MVDGGQAGDVADELVQQRWLQQIRLLGDEWLLGQNHIFGSSWVSGQQTPVDVATVTEIRIVTVLLVERSRLVTSFFVFLAHSSCCIVYWAWKNRIVTALLVERSQLVTQSSFFSQELLLSLLLGLEDRDCHCPVRGKPSVSYFILFF